MKIVVDGIAKVMQRFTALSTKMEKSIVPRGLTPAAKTWQDQAVGRAPSGSGRLKSAVRIWKDQRAGSASASVGVSARDCAHAVFVLLGHRVGRRSLGDARQKVPANDFLKRTFAQSREQVQAAAVESWTDQVESETP